MLGVCIGRAGPLWAAREAVWALVGPKAVPVDVHQVFRCTIALSPITFLLRSQSGSTLSVCGKLLKVGICTVSPLPRWFRPPVAGVNCNVVAFATSFWKATLYSFLPLRWWFSQRSCLRDPYNPFFLLLMQLSHCPWPGVLT